MMRRTKGRTGVATKHQLAAIGPIGAAASGFKPLLGFTLSLLVKLVNFAYVDESIIQASSETRVATLSSQHHIKCT